MVTHTTRKVMPTSESTITNEGRISPPPVNGDEEVIIDNLPSTETDNEEEEGDEVQPLPVSTASGLPLSAVIRSSGPSRNASAGTLVSALTIESIDSEDNRNALPSQHGSDSSGVVPRLPPPQAFHVESRDVSTNSRDSLRLQVQKRRTSLTTQESFFLDDLLMRGNEVEVQLALEKLQDTNIFFDHSTPRHYLGQPLEESDTTAAASSDAMPPAPELLRSTSQSSLKRLQILEQRRHSVEHQTLWRAHKSGLAVSGAGSRASIARRASSFGSSASSSVVPRVPPTAGEVFRARLAKRVASPTRQKKVLPPLSGRAQHPRSQSMVVPHMPSPAPMLRRNSSSASRKSVTFTAETDGTPKPKQKSKAKKTLRRSVSDTNALLEDRAGVDIPPLMEREASNASIPSLHHAHPIRQDSVSSIPSLHHGHPIRQDSVSSIPSLHHGHPIRQDSISSIPSLHHAQPIRQDSVSSIPSLHHAHPIRQESMSSIPSLYHGHALVDDMSSSMNNASGQINNFEAASEIANAWLQQPQQQQQQEQHNRQESLGSLPHDVTFPSEDTYPETVNTEATAASTAYTTTGDEEESAAGPAKPVLMRLASRNTYEGEGVEVQEFSDEPVIKDDESSHYTGRNINGDGVFRRAFPSVVSVDASIRTCNSWDTGVSSYQFYPHQSYSEIFRDGISRSLSHDDQAMGNIFLGPSGKSALLVFRRCNFAYVNISRLVFRNNTAGLLEFGNNNDADSPSWDMFSETEDDPTRMDSWNILKDEYANGYGGGNTLEFMILGTDADDEASQPHVLSPPLMESLQAFMPLTKSGQNFYLKYSMVRDGASLHSFLKRARGVHYSVLALETIDGEVFGAFTGQPWRKNWNYFGSGESFLWRMRGSRLEKTHDILEQAQKESEIDVYPYTGENRFIQLCTHDRIAVGGGTPAEKKEDDETMSDNHSLLIKPHEWGFGLAIASDFMTGTSSPCVTFGSPGLCATHSDSTPFEIVNMELWTLTPCRTEGEAEKLELGKLFLSRD